MSDCIHKKVCGKCYAEPKECGCYEPKREKCHDCLSDFEPFECNECHRRDDFKLPNYCHYCGREVVYG